jgi:tRNA(Ile)-lysidine synthase
MLPRNGIWAKPLLGVSKNELTDFLQERNLKWCEDLSNQQAVYKRNRVRLHLVPLLSELAGGLPSLNRFNSAL